MPHDLPRPRHGYQDDASTRGLLRAIEAIRSILQRTYTVDEVDAQNDLVGIQLDIINERLDAIEARLDALEAPP